ncbi:MAG: response regulator [Promethearchaeota archaeon]
MKNILVVEDNEQNMYLISFILKKSGYNVIQAKNGKEGILKARESKPALIIMDWQLPDISGIEVTKELRKINEFKEVPIIFCTSNVMLGDKERAMRNGATGYIEKPIIPDTFIEEIKKYLP